MKNRCDSTCKLRKSVSFEQKGQTQRQGAAPRAGSRTNKSAGLPAVCLIQARMALTATTQKIFCASIYRRFFYIDLSNAKHLSMQPYIFCIRLVLTRSVVRQLMSCQWSPLSDYHSIEMLRSQ